MSDRPIHARMLIDGQCERWPRTDRRSQI